MAVPDTIKYMLKRHRSSCCELGINKKSHCLLFVAGGVIQLECENGFQVTARQKMGLQSYNHKKLNSPNNLDEFGKRGSQLWRGL